MSVERHVLTKLMEWSKILRPTLHKIGHLRHGCNMFFYVFNVFLFSERFLFEKNVGNVQSGKQINKKHFQNNSNEMDL